MEAETIIEVIRGLVGKTEPYADSAIDAERFKSVKNLIEIHEALTQEIDTIAEKYADSPYGSAKEIGQYCQSYLTELNL